MDKLLKPKDLDVLPTDSNAASVFKYWIATFESFLQAVETGQVAIDPSVEVSRQVLLVNFLTPIVTSPRGNRFLFVVVDEYSRFPFAFACKDNSASSVVKYLSTLFSLFGFPSYVHSDRGTAFLSRELKDYLHSRGIATSHSTPYHSTGNSQYERFNQTIWKTISLMINLRRVFGGPLELVGPLIVLEIICLINVFLCPH